VAENSGAFGALFSRRRAFGSFRKIELKDIIVINNDKGKPDIKLTGTAQTAFEKSGADKAHISLTHEKENAIAMIVLEGA